jgi:hypothetical protein
MNKALWLAEATLTCTLSSSANTTYTYTGNHFTESSGANGPNLSNFISFTLEVLTPVPANWLGGPPLDRLSWILSDGVTVLSGQNTTNPPYIALYTDATGNIVDWTITATQGDCLYIATFNPPYACCPGPIDQSYVFGNGQFLAPTAYAKNSEIPGSWSVVSDVPERAAWVMLLCPS